MSLKVKKAEFTGRSLKADLDLFEDVSASKKVKDKIKNEVGEFLVEQTLSKVANARSPLDGNPYKGSLSSKYATRKSKAGRTPRANMEFDGDMLDAFTFKPTTSGIEIGILNDSTEAKKADGHNNFSGDSSLPRRQFVPGRGVNYNKTIRAEVDKIINDNIVQDQRLPRRELRKIENRTQFWDFMSTFYEGLSRSEIRGAITRSVEISRLLEEFNLLRFLRG